MRILTCVAIALSLTACSDDSRTGNAQTTNITIADQLLSSESSPLVTGYILDGETIYNETNCVDEWGPSGSAPFVNNAFISSDSGTYNHSSSHRIFDSIGMEHSLQVYYVKMCDKNWHAHVLIDSRDVGEPLISSDTSRWTAGLGFNDENVLEEQSLHLVSYWSPLDSDGQDNGALGPLPISSGGTNSVELPPTSSNFTIDFGQVSLQ